MNQQPKFTPFETSYEHFKGMAGSTKLDATGFYNELAGRVAKSVSKMGQRWCVNTLNRMAAERQWIANQRPFYRVWPSVLDSFKRTRLDIPCSALEIPHGIISIEVPEKETRVLVFEPTTIKDPSGDRWLQVAVQDETGITEETEIVFPLRKGGSIEERFSLAQKNSDNTINADEQKRDEWVLRIVVCVSLIAKDPRFVESICLAKDRPRRTTANADDLQEKAKKRGVFGWDVGRSVEVGPHVRRPHFGIRWCGTKQEGLEPRLVPISGAVVKGRKITDVPTGWHGEIEG